MSLLHSLYAWGVLLVVVVSTLFLTFVGTEYWTYLAMFWAVLPLVSCYLFFTSPIPDFAVNENTASKTRHEEKSRVHILPYVHILRQRG